MNAKDPISGLDFKQCNASHVFAYERQIINISKIESYLIYNTYEE